MPQAPASTMEAGAFHICDYSVGFSVNPGVGAGVGAGVASAASTGVMKLAIT